MEQTDNNEQEETKISDKEEIDNHEKEEESSSSVTKMRVRRSTGVGGKVPRLAVNFKQVFRLFVLF